MGIIEIAALIGRLNPSEQRVRSLVAQWASTYCEMLPALRDEPSADAARSLLTAWARLQRTEPRWLREAVGAEPSASRWLCAQLGRADLVDLEQSLQTALNALVRTVWQAINPLDAGLELVALRTLMDREGTVAARATAVFHEIADLYLIYALTRWHLGPQPRRSQMPLVSHLMRTDGYLLLDAIQDVAAELKTIALDRQQPWDLMALEPHMVLLKEWQQSQTFLDDEGPPGTAGLLKNTPSSWPF